MSYIGKEPQTGAYSMLDALTASATASYSLTLDSVAFVPESANHLLVSLNGSIQKAGSSYTVSGSTLTFSSTLASSDSIDFVLALGNVLDIGTPSDATVTNAKTNFVSTSSAAGLQIKGDGTTDGTLQLNCSQNSHGIKLKSPAHSTSSSYTLTFPGTDPSADKFLKTDGSGNLSFADAGGGAFTFIQSQIVSTNTTVVNFNDVFSATYDNYLFIFDATLQNVANMEMRYRTGTPTNDNYTGSGTYRYAFSGNDSNGGSVAQNSNSNNKWTMGDTTYAAASIGAPAVHGFIHFNTPFTASTQRTWSGTFVVYNNNDEQRAYSGGGRIVNGTQMTGFGFSCSGGDFTKFTGRVYGVADS